MDITWAAVATAAFSWYMLATLSERRTGQATHATRWPMRTSENPAPRKRPVGNTEVVNREADSPTEVLNRLRRAQGRPAAVIAMIEAEHDRKDVVTQLATCSSSLDRAAQDRGGRDASVPQRAAPGTHPPLTEAALEKLFLTLG